MTVTMLDPTVAPEPDEVSVARRIDSLDDRVLGLLANGKVNADRLLELVRDCLGARYRLREVIVRAKPSATRVATTEVLDELARACDAVVTAIGD